MAGRRRRDESGESGAPDGVVLAGRQVLQQAHGAERGHGAAQRVAGQHQALAARARLGVQRVDGHRPRAREEAAVRRQRAAATAAAAGAAAAAGGAVGGGVQVSRGAAGEHGGIKDHLLLCRVRGVQATGEVARRWVAEGGRNGVPPADPAPSRPCS